MNILGLQISRDNSVRGRVGKSAVAILTITTEEFDGVRTVFGLTQELPASPYAVEHSDPKNNYSIVLRRAPGQTNVVSAHVTLKVLEDFRPDYLFLIGTAGGHSRREDINLGDVVVANYIDYSGYWKLKDGAFEERKNACDHPSSHLLENFAEGLRRSPTRWRSRLQTARPLGSPDAKALVGGVVAGELLLGDSENAEQQRILGQYKKALAFEMESFGVARTVYQFRSSVHYNPQFLIVRGISDLVDRDAALNDDQRKMWTPIAVEAAATFAKTLIESLLETEV